MSEEVRLAQGLADAGLPIVAVSSETPPDNVPAGPGALLGALAVAEDELFRCAVVPLLLVHPDWATEVQGVADGLGEADRKGLLHLAVAAVSMQARWKTRLALLLGAAPPIEDTFSKPLRLPDPEDDYGATALRAIAEQFESGAAGRVIRRIDLMIEQGVEQMFAFLERRARDAKTG